MIVDVLRNDLGRVCDPGTVRVPRLCRLERTAAVQHLVSTVTGRLAAGRDAFDLLAAEFPGGSITGAPKIRAMEILEGLEPVRRGPYTGALGWIGPDGAMQTSILIRTFVADGRRLTLHVGGGITWGSDPAAEWDETVAKARGPLGAIGGEEVPGDASTRARLGRRRAPPGRRAPPVGLRSRLPARRRRVRDAARPRRAPDRARPSTWRACTDRPTASRSPCRTTSTTRAGRGIAALLAAEGLDGADGDASVRITVSRGVFRRAACCRRTRIVAATLVIQAWPVVAAPAVPPRATASTSSPVRVRRDPQDPLAALKTTSRAEYVYARLEARRAGADDALFLTIDDHLSEGTQRQHLPGPRRPAGRPELATPSLDCAILPGTTRSWLLGWAARVGLRPVEAQLTRRRPRRRPTRRSCRSSVAGILPVTRFDGRADRRRHAGRRGRAAPAPTARR